jgi:hypothetical protein
MLQLKLPDGSIREAPAGATARQIAEGIGNSRGHSIRFRLMIRATEP